MTSKVAAGAQHASLPTGHPGLSGQTAPGGPKLLDPSAALRGGGGAGRPVGTAGAIATRGIQCPRCADSRRAEARISSDVTMEENRNLKMAALPVS